MGYIIELENGFKIWHMGDTGLFGDMKFIGELTQGKANRRVTVLHEGGVLAEGTLADVQANDKVVEPDETFTFALSNLQNAAIDTPSFVGTLTNDDTNWAISTTRSGHRGGKPRRSAGLRVCQRSSRTSEASGLSTDPSCRLKPPELSKILSGCPVRCTASASWMTS
jgi:hypothetical protein